MSPTMARSLEIIAAREAEAENTRIQAILNSHGALLFPPRDIYGRPDIHWIPPNTLPPVKGKFVYELVADLRKRK